MLARLGSVMLRRRRQPWSPWAPQGRMTRALLASDNWTAVLLAFLSIALCCVDVALSEERTVQPGQTFRDCADCPEMVVVPAGKFQMGSSPEETTRDLKDAAKYDKPRAVQGYLDDEQ